MKEFFRVSFYIDTLIISSKHLFHIFECLNHRSILDIRISSNLTHIYFDNRCKLLTDFPPFIW